jgi:cell division protein FtsL
MRYFIFISMTITVFSLFNKVFLCSDLSSSIMTIFIVLAVSLIYFYETFEDDQNQDF